MPKRSKEITVPSIDIDEATNLRLQSMAKPLVDTYDSVIRRLLDLYEQGSSAATPAPTTVMPGAPLTDDGRIMTFDWRNPPQLAHTTVTAVNLEGVMFPKADCYWNTIMIRVIKLMSEQGHDASAIKDALSVNAMVGQKVDNGYKYLPSVGISVQGQDSNAAFRQAFELADKLGIKLEVQFRWQNKEEALYPNRVGSFIV